MNKRLERKTRKRTEITGSTGDFCFHFTALGLFQVFWRIYTIFCYWGKMYILKTLLRPQRKTWVRKKYVIIRKNTIILFLRMSFTSKSKLLFLPWWIFNHRLILHPCPIVLKLFLLETAIKSHPLWIWES